MREKGILYYALGGGNGHFVRGMAVLRKLTKAVRDRSLLVTSSPLYAKASDEGIKTFYLSRRKPWTSSQLSHAISRILRNTRPRLLVVDCFPRGILGELPPILRDYEIPSVFLSRWLSPSYILKPGIKNFLCRHYSHWILAEQMAECILDSIPLPRTDVPPIVIRDACEVLSPGKARDLCGVGDQDFFILAVPSGSPARRAGLASMVRKVCTRLGDSRMALRITGADGKSPAGNWSRHFPLVEIMPGADLLIGAPGYNLFYEGALTGLPAVFIPQNRLYDDQFYRARSASVASSPDEIEEFIRLYQSRGPSRIPSLHENGAQAAADKLMEMYRG